MASLQSMLQWLEAQDSRIIVSILVVLVFFLFRFIFRRIIIKRIADIKVRHAWLQTVNAFTLGFVLLLLVVQWLSWFQHVLTLLTLIAAALTIISKEFLLNIIAYGVIIWRGLFNLDDRVQIGQVSGDVVKIGTFYVTVAEIGNWIQGDEYTGRIVKIPNAEVLVKAVFNYTKGSELIWDEINIELGLESNRKKAKELGLEVATRHAHQITPRERREITNNSGEFIFPNSEPSLYLDLVEGKLKLYLRYLSPFQQRRAKRQTILEDLLDQIELHDDVVLAHKKGKS